MPRRLNLLLAVLVLAGCASTYPGMTIAVGTPRDQVIASMGPPTGIVPLPNGAQRLQYSGQPAGQYAYMVDIDPAGRVTSARQVLNELDFNRIVPGQWTGLDVQREFGPPALVERVSSWNGPVLTYRWRDIQSANMFYSVYLDQQGIVRRAHPSMEVRDRFFDRL
jgi:hypothetical protein